MAQRQGASSERQSSNRQKTQEAKAQTSQVTQSARHSGQQVMRDAMGQGRQTAAIAGRQTRNLTGQASAQLRQQAEAQQKRAAARLRDIGDELESMSYRDEQHGIAGSLAHQAADQAHHAADWLDQHEPGALVEEVREFARRRPGVFLAGAAILGLVAGRLTRGLTAGGTGHGQQAGPQPGAEYSSDGHREGYGPHLPPESSIERRAR